VPRLPEEVQRLGVVTRKTTPDFLMVVNLQSPDGASRDYLSNYALTQVKDRLTRLDGVGDVPVRRVTMPCVSGSIRAAPPRST
jgi:multidrug efflux pump subunit AcrB